MSQINEPPKEFVADKQGGGVHAPVLTLQRRNHSAINSFKQQLEHEQRN